MSAIAVRSIDAGVNDVNPEILLSNEQKEKERQKLSHYIYFPLGSPPISDDVSIGSEHYGDLWIGDRRTVHRSWIRRGVIEELHTWAYMERTQTAAMLDKENVDDVDEFSPHLMLAGEQASELHTAYNDRSDPRGLHILHSITGAPHDTVGKLGKLLMPVIPATIIKVAAELRNQSPKRLEQIQDTRLKEIGKKLLGEMYASAEAGLRYAIAYIQRTEAEQIARATPGGHGKLKVDSADFYYYFQLEREPNNATGSIMELTRQASDASAAPKELEHKECPRCYELIKMRATFCRYCQMDLAEKKGGK